LWATDPATIRWIKPFAIEEPEQFSGDNLACEDEVKFNAVRFDGAGVKSEDLDGLYDGFAANPLQNYTSNQTVSISQSGFNMTGVGSSESIVSQAAADRVAQRIATRAAEIELSQIIPPVLSIGEGS
jgi:hypothetical protein